MMPRRALPTCSRVAAAVLIASGGAALSLGPHPVGLVIFPVPVAVYWAAGWRRCAVGLVIWAVVGALMTGFIPGAGPAGAIEALVSAVWYAGAAALGLLMGNAIARRWSFGQAVALFTAVVAGVSLLVVAATWDLWNAQMAVWFEQMAASIEKGPSGQSAQMEQAAGLLLWMKANWPYVCFGLMFALTFLTACVATGLSNWSVHRYTKASGLSGRFSQMRTSEWLVWLVAVTALLWLWDYRAPQAAVRLLAWNGAIVLAAVYWVNGLSVLVFALERLPATALTYLLVAVILLFFKEVLCIAGLFDTWADFRRRVEALASSAARASDDSDNDV